MEFDDAAARAVGQKPFHIDLCCLAQVPLAKRWFPDLSQTGFGIIGTAGARLRERIDVMLSDLVTRNRDLIEMRGPR
jgi:hypothetical protein